MSSSNVENPNSRTLLVTISATALSTVGFGLSILAIWIQWIAPSVSSQPPTSPLASRPFPSAQSIMILSNEGNEINRPEKHTKKKVYSMDSLSPSLQQEDTVSNLGDHVLYHKLRLLAPNYPAVIYPSRPIPLEDKEKKSLVNHVFDHGLDSDSSRPLFHKMGSPLLSKRRQVPPSPEASNKGIFDPSASATVTGEVLDGSKPASRTDTPRSCHSSLSDGARRGCPTCRFFTFLRKNRRASVAVRVQRTYPYEAPYYATPPIPLPVRTETGVTKKARRPVTHWGPNKPQHLINTFHEKDLESKEFAYSRRRSM